MDNDDTVNQFDIQKIKAKDYADLKKKINIHKEGIGIKGKDKIITGFVERESNFDEFYVDLCKKADISESDCKDMEKSEIYRIKRPKSKDNSPFLSNYLPIAFFTIVATAIAWEIAGNINTITLDYFSVLYGNSIAYLIVFAILLLIFFGFLIIGYFIFRSWKNEDKYDYEYIHFPH